LNEARPRHSTVEAVHVWQFPAIAVTHYGGEAVPVFTQDDIEKAAEELLSDAVKNVTAGEPEIAVTATLKQRRPVDALLTVAEGPTCSLSAREAMAALPAFFWDR